MRHYTLHRSFRASSLGSGSERRFAAVAACLALATALSLAACEEDAGVDASESEATSAALAEPLTAGTSEVSGELLPVQGAVAAGASVAHVCRELMVRERDCSAVFIPALVAERVRLDLPAGIAARAASAGREALVNEALEEYADDSRDDRIESTCRELAQQLPPERGRRLSNAGQACLALEGCEPFVACAVPLSIQP